MNRTPVSSSNLHSVGYDASSRTLEIEFNDGSVYQYYDVPPAIYSGLMNAASHGTYFHANIRDRFRFRKLR